VEGEPRRGPTRVIGPDRDIPAFHPWDCDAPGWGSHVGPGPVQATIERMELVQLPTGGYGITTACRTGDQPRR
jgi:hypothetical protein